MDRRGVIPPTGRRLARVLATSVVVALVSAAFAPPAGATVPAGMMAWGANAYGQLGDGTTVAHTVPSPVATISDAIDLSGGREHAVALRVNGSVWTWGRNSNGQLGDGTTTNRPSPIQVAGLAGVIEVATGHYHSLALMQDGSIRAWGLNASGQLGDGSTTRRTRPVPVSGLTGVIHVAGGRDMSYALRSDGTVWAWGLNSNGELGDGTRTNRSVPVRVSGLTGVASIAGGRNHGLAVRSDGTVWAWGDNQYGQLGDGSISDRLQPVRVGSLTSIVAVSAGAHHSVALRNDGIVYTWGRNYRGQLGDGTTTMRPSPTPVSGLSGVTSIGSGRDHVLAVLADGSVRAWGRNDTGQIGDGTTTTRTRPTVVLGLAGVSEVHGGAEYSVALRGQGGEPDLTPPSTPGQPTGTSPSAGEISISWAGSTDPAPASPPITYRVYRDGDPTPIGETTATSYSDLGLDPGSVHTYEVDAVDAADNESGISPVSDPITVSASAPAIFADDFSSGNLSNWTGSTRITIDATQGSPAAPSARGQVSGQSAWAYRTLGSTFSTVCFSTRVNLSALSGGTGVDLFRLRTASDGPIIRSYVSSTGVLYARSDFAGVNRSSGVALGSGWHTVELCGTVGAATSWDLLRDGVVILNDWVANTGTTPVGRVQIGDTAAKTFTVNFDDVRLDQVPG